MIRLMGERVLRKSSGSILLMANHSNSSFQNGLASAGEETYSSSSGWAANKTAESALRVQSGAIHFGEKFRPDCSKQS